MTVHVFCWLLLVAVVSYEVGDMLFSKGKSTVSAVIGAMLVLASLAMLAALVIVLIRAV